MKRLLTSFFVIGFLNAPSLTYAANGVGTSTPSETFVPPPLFRTPILVTAPATPVPVPASNPRTSSVSPPSSTGSLTPVSVQVEFPGSAKSAASCSIESIGLILGRTEGSGPSPLQLNTSIQVPSNKVTVRCTSPGFEAEFTELERLQGRFTGTVTFNTPEFITAPVVTLSQTKIGINLPKFGNQKIVIGGKIYYRLTSDQHRITLSSRENGQPEVPTTTLMVALPADATVQSIDVSGIGSQTFDGISLIPWDNRAEESPNTIAIPSSPTAAKVISPDSPFDRRVADDRVYNLYRLTLPLVGYDPALKSLTTYKKLNVTFHHAASKLCYTKAELPSRDSLDRLWAEEITGPRSLLHAQQRSSLTSCAGTNLLTLPKTASTALMAVLLEGGAQLLIVTSDSFKDAANRLAVHKQSRGIDTQVEALSPSQLANLKPWLSQQADSNPNLRWVLLLGDTDTIPTYYERQLPVSELNGRNVKPAGDIYYSQFPVGNAPYSLALPTRFAIGRIPVKDITPEFIQAANDARTVAVAKARANQMPEPGPLVFDTVDQVINKIIQFENVPTEVAAYYQAPTIAATLQLNGSNPGALPIANAYAKMMEDYPVKAMQLRGLRPERIYATDPEGISVDQWSDHNPINSTLLGDYNAGEIPELSFRLDGNQGHIDDAVNRGTGILLHRGHGDLHGWQFPGFTWKKANWGDNASLLPLVLSINCLTGHFDNESIASSNLRFSITDHFSEDTQYSQSIGEQLALSANGAIAVIASTRTTNGQFNNDFATFLVDGFLESAFGDDPGTSDHLGDVYRDAKLKQAFPTTTGGPDEKAYNSNTLSYNLLGDPSLQFRLRTPFSVESGSRMNISGKNAALNFRVSSRQCPACVLGDQNLNPIVVAYDKSGKIVGRALATFQNGSYSVTLTGNSVSNASSYTIAGASIKTVYGIAGK